MLTFNSLPSLLGLLGIAICFAQEEIKLSDDPLKLQEDRQTIADALHATKLDQSRSTALAKPYETTTNAETKHSIAMVMLKHKDPDPRYFLLLENMISWIISVELFIP